MSSTNGTNVSPIHVSLLEQDIIKLILEFLQQRQLHISMINIERETGVINGSFSEDILFLRQLILDGQWDDVINFIQPLKEIDLFDSKQFIYIVLKHQLLELLCLKTEAQVQQEVSAKQIVNFLNNLHPYVPDENEFKKLSFLLTLKHIQDTDEYKNWNPSAGRVECFQQLFPLVHRFLQVDQHSTPIAQGDRLMQLIIKGLLYESSVEYCQTSATNSVESFDLTDPTNLLHNAGLYGTDVSLVSWLHALPSETFSYPFEQKSLKLNITKFRKPNLEASWAEHVLSTPFKPQTMFPFNAMPTGKPRATELLSRSLAVQYDGLSSGLDSLQNPVDHTRNKTKDVSRSLAISTTKDNNPPNNIAKLPTVVEVIQEETESSLTPPRLPSPVKENVSPEKSDRIQKPKQAKSNPPSTKTQNTNENEKKTQPPKTSDPTKENLVKEYQQGRAKILDYFNDDDADEDQTPNIQEVNDTTKYIPIDNFDNSLRFVPLVSIDDNQVIRSVDVHPTGKYFAVGSNSKMLRVCIYPDTQNYRTNSSPESAQVLYTKGKHHQGSIYCIAWSPSGKLIATGSNDKLVKVVRLDMDKPNDPLNNTEITLTHHTGTVRDLFFMNTKSKSDSILLSGGAGDCKIYVTDVNSQRVINNYSGHQGHIYSLFSWNPNNFISGSQDGTTRLWDIRQSDCINIITSSRSSSPVAAVAIDSTDQLLAAGYEDATCLLYDLRGKRIVQIHQPHSNEIRSARFSVNSYYLLTASYDKNVAMTDLSGDLTKLLPLSYVATHTDKIIQARWHPNEISFVTTSADRRCIVWVPPK